MVRYIITPSYPVCNTYRKLLCADYGILQQFYPHPITVITVYHPSVLDIMKAVLGLEDGTSVVGTGFGAEGTSVGELVFSTQMTGYMEALTDPSYNGQILMFTFPLIGNYGVDRKNFQARRVWAGGCITRELCSRPTVQPDIATFFESEGIPGMTGVDTRKLTIKTREHGTLRAALVTGSDDREEAIRLARAAPDISTEDLIPTVTCSEAYHIPGKGKKVAVIDLGIKKNIVLSLLSRGADVRVYPHNTRADEILAHRPDALFISNGPGDPERAIEAVRTVSDLAGQLPIFGICMGIQISALALGGHTYKMKFGHRGANQPVRNIDGSVAITTQNHGFAVDAESLPEGAQVTYLNLNDRSVEGFEDRYLNMTCVQFHPEAHAGPHDTEKPFFDCMFGRIP
jgi:carbamoyl-phosphate synthase small subunit